MENKPVDNGKTEPKIVQVRKLTVLKVGVYKGYNYFLQRIGTEFQYIIFHKGYFYQSYISVTPRNKGEDYTQQDLVELTMVIKNFMETTVEALIQKEAMKKGKEYKTPYEKALKEGEEMLKDLAENPKGVVN